MVLEPKDHSKELQTVAYFTSFFQVYVELNSDEAQSHQDFSETRLYKCISRLSNTIEVTVHCPVTQTNGQFFPFASFLKPKPFSHRCCRRSIGITRQPFGLESPYFPRVSSPRASATLSLMTSLAVSGWMTVQKKFQMSFHNISCVSCYRQLIFNFHHPLQFSQSVFSGNKYS